MDPTMSVMDRVRKALGRTGPLAKPPIPPPISEPIARLVHTDIGLPELFASRARDMKMAVDFSSADELAEKLLDFLRSKPIRRVVFSDAPLFRTLGLIESVRTAGFDVKTWAESTLDELYDADCAVTDVTYAVAETGSLVIRTDAGHGRGLSLVPMYHVAVVEPWKMLPDLVDLFDKLAEHPPAANVVLISGPSKTADIEMNVVTGVHGPNHVQTFILR